MRCQLFVKVSCEMIFPNQIIQREPHLKRGSSRKE
ncbi:rCG39980 [Rattus norvegicus]|uniref:RCG39980 n=1 Tax=Rattus norvegicus TaxID=10116 RepID=A6I672_RAT|nr:rCG39980 [Rattus norvegicus]